ncbi:MAG: lipocalin-like domain-containing protein [Oscillospiraceae bacterium]|nr:lipocalin-like domain-containing protein [Oscillospiraceae bacterium]
MYGNWLTGTWKLDSFIAVDEDNQMIDVMGPGAEGFICYSGDGWVSVQILKAGRLRYDVPDTEGGTEEQTLSAARGCFSYAGKYTVDEENAVVYHHLEFSLIPNWIGSTQKRYITKESENILVLSADPVRIGPDGKKRKTRLRWIKSDLI